MIFDWYRIFNIAEFESLGLVSKEYVLDLEDLGEKTVTALRGEMTSILYEGVLLSIGMSSKNPFAFDGLAVYIDLNDDVFLGIEVPVED